MATWKKVITTADDANYKNSNVTVPTYTGTGVISVNGSYVISSSAQANVSGDSGNAALYDSSGTPTLKSGITASEVRSAIGAGTSNLALGTSGSTALAGNTSLLQIGTTGTTAMAGNTAVGENNVSGNSGNAAVFDNSGTPTLKTGITQAEMRSAIGAQVSGAYAAAAGNANQSFATDDLAVSGNLTVAGSIDTVSQTNMAVVDKTITLAEGANTEGNCDGAGIVLDSGQTNAPKIQWFDDSSTNNSAGCIGNGWQMNATNENTTTYHLMGFKTGSGAPSSGSNTTNTKAEGEGSFYWDTSGNDLYVCTDSNSSVVGG